MLLSGVLVNHSLIRLETPPFSPAVSYKRIKYDEKTFRIAVAIFFHGLDLKTKPNLSLIQKSSLRLCLAKSYPAYSEDIIPMNYTVLVPFSFQ